MADFDPRQLDQLEDALESLEYVDDLDSLELAPELSERLREYQDVLALCRDAFPLEAPDDAVLADVLAEAREVSRRPRLRDAADADRSVWRRFWERWRGTVVPGFALAATAAAVLWILDPAATHDALLTTPTPTQTKQDERAVEPEVEPEPTQPASEHEADEPEPAVTPPEPEVEPEPEVMPEVIVKDPLPRAKKKKSASKPVIEPEVEPLDKEDAWNSLGRGDTARRKGDCDRARSIYQDVIDASPNAQITARARAGIGLCLEQDRRDAEATKHYEQARRSNPAIDTWISHERDEQPMPGKSKKAPMPAPPINADEQSL